MGWIWYEAPTLQKHLTPDSGKLILTRLDTFARAISGIQFDLLLTHIERGQPSDDRTRKHQGFEHDPDERPGWGQQSRLYSLPGVQPASIAISTQSDGLGLPQNCSSQ